MCLKVWLLKVYFCRIFLRFTIFRKNNGIKFNIGIIQVFANICHVLKWETLREQYSNQLSFKAYSLGMCLRKLTRIVLKPIKFGSYSVEVIATKQFSPWSQNYGNCYCQYYSGTHYFRDMSWIPISEELKRSGCDHVSKLIHLLINIWINFPTNFRES